jgi:hypothetical protein
LRIGGKGRTDSESIFCRILNPSHPQEECRDIFSINYRDLFSPRRGRPKGLGRGKLGFQVHMQSLEVRLAGLPPGLWVGNIARLRSVIARRAGRQPVDTAAWEPPSDAATQALFMPWQPCFAKLSALSELDFQLCKA